jgi:hypothetical protein
MARMEPMVVEEARGTPVSVYGRTLTPVCQVASRLRRRGTIQAARVDASGWGVVIVRPVAVVEGWKGEEHVLPIRDVTASTLGQMAMAGMIVSALAVALVFALRWARSR